MHLRIHLLIIVCLFFSQTFAQDKFEIKGTVADTAQKPVLNGISTLFSANDSALIAFADIQNGNFAFQNLDSGTYFIRITSLEFEDYYENIQLNQNLQLSFILKTKPLVLKEVQISNTKRAIGFENGNIKVNVENSVLSAIPDAIEILAKLPTVQVSADRESIAIIGRGTPLIYLGNQRISLNELNAIAVGNIKTIEIIQNPSAKYESDGRAVILIILKVNTQQTRSISLYETASQKRFFENRMGLNAGIKHMKTEFKLNFQYNLLKRFEGLDGIISNLDWQYNSNFKGTSIGPRQQYIAGIGIYHTLKGNDYISLSVNGRIQKESSDVNTRGYLNEKGSETHSYTQNTNTNNRPFFNANFNYQKTFQKSNIKLFSGAQHSAYTISTHSDINNNLNNTQLLPSEKRIQNFWLALSSARIDIEKTFKNKRVWESGISMNLSRSNTLFDVYYFADTSQHITRYIYHETNEALYSQLTGRLKKLQYFGGVRIENTQLQGGFRDSAKKALDRNFIFIAPKFKFDYPLDSHKTLTLNLARSIRRPNYNSANQVTNYITPFLERSNNINVNPSISEEISVTLQTQILSLSITAYQTHNPTAFIGEFDSSLQKLRLIYKNLQIEKGMNINLSFPFEYKRFSSTNTVVVTLSRTRDTRAVQLKTSPFYYLYTYNQYKLPKGYNFMFSAWINTNQNLGMFRRKKQYSVDFSLSKVFFKYWTVTANAFDIFRSLNYVETFQVNGIYSSTIYLENSKEYSIALRYNFGKIKDARFKNKEVNENSNRIN